MSDRRIELTWNDMAQLGGLRCRQLCFLAEIARTKTTTIPCHLQNVCYDNNEDGSGYHGGKKRELGDVRRCLGVEYCVGVLRTFQQTLFNHY